MGMFCPQCGKENRDGATFCTSCGQALPNTRLGTETSDAEETAHDSESVTKRIRSSWDAIVLAARSAYASHKKLCIAIGAAVCAIIIICIAAAIGASAGVYIDWAKQVAFDENSYTTLDEVFSYYLTSPSWSAHRDGTDAVVDISGNVQGTGSKLKATLWMELTEDGSNWTQCGFTDLQVGNRSLSNSNEMNTSVRNIIAAYDAGWESLAPYAGAFTTNYASWTGYTWEMAVYSQRAGAAEYVLTEVGDTLYPGLSNLFSLADSATRQSANEQVMDAIDSAYNSTPLSTTLNEMLDALRATLGFLLFLFGLSG